MSVDKQVENLHIKHRQLEELLMKQMNFISSILPDEYERAFWQQRLDSRIDFILRLFKRVIFVYFLVEIFSLPINYYTTLAPFKAHDTWMTFIAYLGGWLIFTTAYFLAKQPKLHAYYSVYMMLSIGIGLTIIQVSILSIYTTSMTWRGSLMIMFAYMFCYLSSGVKHQHIFATLLFSALVSYLFLLIVQDQQTHIWVLFNIMVLGNVVGFGLALLMTSTERISFIRSLIIDIDQKINAILYQQVLQLSQQDTLTLLGNRRNFDHIFTQQFQRCHEHDYPLAVLFIDVDYFKRYNDHYGHQQGDWALIQVAQTLKKYITEQDVATRYGGEEFVILLPNTTVEKSIATAENILADIRSQKIEHQASLIQDRLTVSIGLTVYRGEAFIQQGDLLRIADIALYQAKNSGRDQMVFLLPEPKKFQDDKEKSSL